MKVNILDRMVVLRVGGCAHSDQQKQQQAEQQRNQRSQQPEAPRPQRQAARQDRLQSRRCGQASNGEYRLTVLG